MTLKKYLFVRFIKITMYINKDKTIVNFNIKLKFDEDDEKSEVRTFNVIVTDFVDEDKDLVSVDENSIVEQNSPNSLEPDM